MPVGSVTTTSSYPACPANTYLAATTDRSNETCQLKRHASTGQFSSGPAKQVPIPAPPMAEVGCPGTNGLHKSSVINGTVTSKGLPFKTDSQTIVKDPKNAIKFLAESLPGVLSNLDISFIDEVEEDLGYLRQIQFRGTLLTKLIECSDLPEELKTVFKRLNEITKCDTPGKLLLVNITFQEPGQGSAVLKPHIHKPPSDNELFNIAISEDDDQGTQFPSDGCLARKTDSNEAADTFETDPSCRYNKIPVNIFATFRTDGPHSGPSTPTRNGRVLMGILPVPSKYSDLLGF